MPIRAQSKGSEAGRAESKKRLTLLASSLILFFLYVVLTPYEPLQRIELPSKDLRTRISLRSPPPTKLVIALIDQQSLTYFAEKFTESWPISRALYVPLLELFQKAGVRGVAFDMLFTESSFDRPDQDQQFADALARTTFPVVVGAHANVLGREVVAGDIPGRLPTFANATLPLRIVREAVDGVGNTVAEADQDGVFRRFIPAGEFQGSMFPSLPLSLYLALPDSDRENTLEWLKSVGSEQGRIVPRFYADQQAVVPEEWFATVPLSHLIESFLLIDEGQEPMISLDLLKDAYVFIGSSAPGLRDLRPTAVAAELPGVFFNATVFTNILNRDVIRPLPRVWAFLLCLLFVLLSLPLQIFPTRSTTQLFGMSVLLVVFLLTHNQIAASGYDTPLVLPMATLLTAFLIGFAYQYQFEGAQRRFIKKAFTHYLSPAVIEQILDDPETLSLGGKTRTLTVFFSDIQGFSSLAEKMTAAELVELMNDYLTTVTNIILNSGGTLDKYIGDAVVAFWNAPVDFEGHQRVAVESAIIIQKELERQQQHYIDKYGVEVVTRIGLHTGPVVVGNVGTTTRFNYTFIGDAGNIASRLEGSNKPFGTTIMFSQDIEDALPDAIPRRKIGDIIVVGRESPLTVYEPLEVSAVTFDSKEHRVYEKALAAFESNQLEKARSLFAILKEVDPVARAYYKRIEEMKCNEYSAVWKLSSK